MSQVTAKSAGSDDQTKVNVILRAKSVQRSFQMGESNIAILRNVDLSLREGEFVAIEGRSGSGKSTLLHILGGLDGPDQGTLEFAGREYMRESGSERRASRIPAWATRFDSWIVIVIAVSIPLLFGIVA